MKFKYYCLFMPILHLCKLSVSSHIICPCFSIYLKIINSSLRKRMLERILHKYRHLFILRIECAHCEYDHSAGVLTRVGTECPQILQWNTVHVNVVGVKFEQ